MSEVDEVALRGRLRLRRHRRSAAGRRSTPPTCSSMPDPDDGGDGSVLPRTPTVSLICNIVDPITKEDYARDPRNIAQQGRGVPQVDRHRRHRVLRPRARVLHLRRRPLRHRTSTAATTSSTRSRGSGTPAAQEGPNLGYKPRYKEGYFPVPPTDSLPGHPPRDGARRWRRSASGSRRSTTRWRPAGQAEIDMRFLPLVKMGDALMWYKYSSRTSRASTARRRRSCRSRSSATTAAACTATSRIWKGEKPLFAGDGYAGMCEMAMHYIGGILKHAPALAAFTNPDTNSYRRLVPGFEAPVNLAYSSRNRSAAVRIPMYSPSPKAKRIEVRFPDPDLQRLPRLRGHADGRPRRHREEARRRASRSTRTSTRSRPRS